MQALSALALPLPVYSLSLGMVFLLHMFTSLIYSTLASVWLATADFRVRALSGSHLLVKIIAHGTLKLLVSFILSVALYSSLYATLVPDEERSHEVHFLPCPLSAADPFAWPMQPPSPPRQLAKLWFDTDEFRPAPLEKREPPTQKLLPKLAPGWSHSSAICLTLPESPMNMAAGTFVVSLELLSTLNQTLCQDSRAMVRL